jgi:uncharacterized membrane protein YccC
MVVLLLALAGEPPEPTMAARLIATVIGSAMALAAYGLWPTREYQQIRPTLVALLRAYGAYLASLGATHEAPERREARNGARLARANAEAALTRMQAEPNTSPSIAELTQSLLTNGNRLARTLMTLEAVLSSPTAAPAWRQAQPLLESGAASLEHIAQALARQAPPRCISSRLRALQRNLARELGGSGVGELAAELVTLSDRLVDNINTLGHIVERAQTSAGGRGSIGAAAA